MGKKAGPSWGSPGVREADHLWSDARGKRQAFGLFWFLEL